MDEPPKAILVTLTLDGRACLVCTLNGTILFVSQRAAECFDMGLQSCHFLLGQKILHFVVPDRPWADLDQALRVGRSAFVRTQRSMLKADPSEVPLTQSLRKCIERVEAFQEGSRVLPSHPSEQMLNTFHVFDDIPPHLAPTGVAGGPNLEHGYRETSGDPCDRRQHIHQLAHLQQSAMPYDPEWGHASVPAPVGGASPVSVSTQFSFYDQGHPCSPPQLKPPPFGTSPVTPLTRTRAMALANSGFRASPSTGRETGFDPWGRERFDSACSDASHGDASQDGRSCSSTDSSSQASSYDSHNLLFMIEHMNLQHQQQERLEAPPAPPPLSDSTPLTATPPQPWQIHQQLIPPSQRPADSPRLQALLPPRSAEPSGGGGGGVGASLNAEGGFTAQHRRHRVEVMGQDREWGWFGENEDGEEEETLCF
eukprot:CAMPEP_0172598360 /NCGR_PEP_ID=MMETSP1068-20121228/18395_1 /TAXON_ID=35684 /ORGANISM="Pseudopedinella elastica, Strain CCMP716" /LENGTH=424 /DNA_ID=CAMNT_0013398205 /DNA_START=70 /DNA_END=1344 /DNA_ORIENTATION=-